MNKFINLLVVCIICVSIPLNGAEKSVDDSPWWLIGPFSCYRESDFTGNEQIENAVNNATQNAWDRVAGLGGRELRSTLIESDQNGGVNLRALLGNLPKEACVYVGKRLIAKQAGKVTARIHASGPSRWFLNTKLIHESKQAGEEKIDFALVAGINSILIKSWNQSKEWGIGCVVEGDGVSEEKNPLLKDQIPTSKERRNVALWSEGSAVAVSSVIWRGYPYNRYGQTPLNDGKNDGAWNSTEVDKMPQWVWIRFPGMREIDEIVVNAWPERRPLDMTWEYTEDGGATFKKLFEVSNSNESVTRAKFSPVVTDNVRIRIDRVAIPPTTGLAMAQLNEVEVYGKDADGVGSLAVTNANPKEKLSSELKAVKESNIKFQTGDATTTISTPWYEVALDRQWPRISQLRLDSAGKGEFNINLLRRSGASVLVAPLFDEPSLVPSAELTMDGNVARYPEVTVAPGVKLQLAIRFNEKSFDVELSTAASRPVPLRAGLFRFDFDFWQTPTTFFGRSTDPSDYIKLPGYVHSPDAGSLYVTKSGGDPVLYLSPAADEFSISARQFLNITLSNDNGAGRYGFIPKGRWCGTVHFNVATPTPFPDIVSKETRLDKISRYALNGAQWTPNKRVLTNSVVSTPCPLALQFYAEIATYAPILNDGVSVMDLVAASAEGYMNGLGGHLCWHGMKVEVTPPGKWTASLETHGYLINSAWHAIRTIGGKPMLDRLLPRLEALAGHLEALDTDGDGIVDTGNHGHWFDTYNLPIGVKEAHSTAVNYDAFKHLAELEELAGRSEKASHYRKRAELIKANYVKMFFNPETGVIGGWRDTEGRLHDRMFPWVNGYAIMSGVIDDAMAKSILQKFLDKMKEINFTQYQYGLPTNLIPMGNDEWNHHGGPAWEGYMNGSITPPYSHYFITALYKHGFTEVAEQMLWAQVGSFDKGTFNAGVFIPFMPRRNSVGSAFYKWDGSVAIGEGYLPENWHAYTTIFAGHYGIRFDKNGYSLEPWSPLKGKKIPCGMPVNGKIQEFME